MSGAVPRILAGAALSLALAAGPALADIGPASKPDADGIVLANVTISVKDLDKSTRFYTALGFEAGDQHDVPAAVAKALGSKAANAKLSIRFMKRDGVVLELVHLDPAPTAKASQGTAAQLGLAHLAFRVDDVDRVAKIVKDNGGGTVDQNRTKLGPPGQGVDILFCTDPDGTMMEVVGPVKG